MKKLFAILAIVAIALGSCKKDDPSSPSGSGSSGINVEQKNTGMYNKLTATWCGPCGQWGWTLNESISDIIGPNAVLMGTYASSTSLMYNTTAAAFKTAFSPASGWPDFCANGKQKTQVTTSGISAAQTKDSVVAEINRHVASEVRANSGFTTKIEGDTLFITSRAKFFKDMPAGSIFYLGAYVIEDGVLNTQNGQTGTVAHHHVLRGSAHASTWGEQITSVTTNGSTFDYTFKMFIPTTWVRANLEVSTVIWEKIGSNYKFVNANKN